ncbi:hypothetical protein [Haloquadratum walsbyi]|jgi:hypothetical protein|uniref:Uncharacterized protein n=1 Tax=Haloquadratum walsbyi J07HQW2 TaxID=1238425 RepID=U1MUI4_9EURY|nr:hypothetical protein [Haloquadratum walsbyi]ERG93999.1 MAG: hypothetical protein J07HQW2_00433 [Haloquadratum walsbyi J07HQW2]
MVSKKIEIAIHEHTNKYLHYILEISNHSEGQWFAEQLELAYDAKQDRINTNLFAGSIQMFLEYGFSVVGAFDTQNRRIVEDVRNEPRHRI